MVMGNWSDEFGRLENELKIGNLYDAVSKRVDRITEAASGLPDKFYKELSVAASEILMLVAADEKKGRA